MTATETRRQLAAGPRPLEVKRQLGQLRADDVFALVSSALAAVALTLVAYAFLLPLSGLLGFVVTALVVFLGIYALQTSLHADGPMVRDRLAAVCVQAVASVMLLALVVVVGFTFKRGFTAISHASFLTDDLADSGPLAPVTEGGVRHAILGTLIMITIALVITIPIAMLAALYLSESRSRFAKLVRTVVEAMTALPSIIAGLFVYALILSAPAKLHFQKSGLAAALALSIMMLPIIIRAADVVLRLVPGTLKEAAAALGASRWRIAWHVVMPTSRSGLMTAIILGAARGIGETSPVLLVAGYTTATNADPLSGPMVSLPLATFILTRSPEPTQIARGFGAGAVLLVVVLVLFVLARVVGGRTPGDLSPRQRRRAARGSLADLARIAPDVIDLDAPQRRTRS